MAVGSEEALVQGSVSYCGCCCDRFASLQCMFVADIRFSTDSNRRALLSLPSESEKVPNRRWIESICELSPTVCIVIHN